jgi:PAS domain S-box-containing protein
MKTFDQKNYERLLLLMAANADCICDVDIPNQELYLSDAFIKNFQVHPKSPKENFELFLTWVHPEDRDMAVEALGLNNADATEDTVFESEYRFLKGNGEYAWVKSRGVALRDEQKQPYRVLAVITDVSNEYFYREMEKIERDILAASLKEEYEISEVVKLFLLRLENMFQGMKASVLWITDHKIQNLSSPSLPIEYIQAINGQAIGINRGSCGTAAFLNERVVVADTLNDVRWADFKELAQAFNLRACWSHPICNAKGEVEATFALYYEVPKYPNTFEIHAIERAQQLISTLISKHQHLKKIKESNELYEFVNKATNDAIYECIFEGDKIKLGESFNRLFGYKALAGVIQSNANWMNFIHPDDLEKRKDSLIETLKNVSKNKWEFLYRFKKADESYVFVREIGYIIRNKEGRAKKMIGVMRDETEPQKFIMLKHLQTKIAEYFRKEQSLKRISKEILAFITNEIKFKTGELWLIDTTRTNIQLFESFALDTTSQIYFDQSKTINSFVKGEGIPGKVWELEIPEVWNDAAHHPFFKRKEALAQANLSTAFGIPIKHANEVIGIIMFTLDKPLHQSDPIIEILSSLGNYLGSEIVRKKREEEMFLLFSRAPEIMAIVSPKGYFVKVNHAFSELLGYPEEEIVFKTFDHFIYKDDLKQTMQEFDETKEGHRLADDYVNRYVTSTGEHKYISWSSSEPFGEEGFVFAYGRDITERVNQFEMLQKQNKVLRDIAWHQSHIVRAPLARMMGIVNLLSEELPAVPYHQQLMQHFMSSAKELDQVISNVVNKTYALESLGSEKVTSPQNDISEVK